MTFDLHLAFSQAYASAAELSLVFADESISGQADDFARVFGSTETPGMVLRQSFDVKAADSGTTKTVPIDLHHQGPVGLFVQVRYLTDQKPDIGQAFVGPLASDDRLSLHFVDSRTVIGNVLHKTDHPERCVARCADGRYQKGCITCQSESVTIKICC